MRFSGRFAESLLTEQLDRVSLSFLVEDLQIRARWDRAQHLLRTGRARTGSTSGGVGRRGLRRLSRMAGAARRANLADPGLRDPAHRSVRLHDRLGQCPDRLLLHRCDGRGTPDRAATDRRTGGRPRSGVISPNDPEAMQRHTDECRVRRFDFVADPSQQMAWLDGPHIKRLIDGADVPVLQRLRGRSDHPEDRLVARGNPGAGRGPGDHPRCQGIQCRDRGWASSGRTRSRGRWHGSIRPGSATRTAQDSLLDSPGRCSLERCAQIGSLLATYAIEVVGTQEYRFGDTFLARFDDAYGTEAADEIAPHLSHLRL